MDSLRPLSRDVAAHIFVDASAASVNATAASVRALVLMLSQACRVPVEDDEAVMRHHLHRTWYEISDDVYYDDLSIDLAGLRKDVGNLSLTSLRHQWKAVMGLNVGLMGEPGYGLVSPVNLTLNRPDGGRSGDDDVEATMQLQRTLLAAASGDAGNAIQFDVDDLRRFRSRYSALVYLRCLAWLAQPHLAAEGCNARQEKGRLVLDVPPDMIQQILGLHGIERTSQVERTVLVPVMRELRDAGLLLGCRVVRNYRGEVFALRMSVSLDESLRLLRSETRAAERSDRVAERRATRPARRPKASPKRPRQPKPASVPAAPPSVPVAATLERLKKRTQRTRR